MIAMHRRLSRLYGASAMAGVQRLGDMQLLTLTVQCIDNRFTFGGEDVAALSAELLLEMLFSPHLSDDGLFDATDIEQEKRCLLERIAAQVNDKRSYAHSKAEELLAPQEPYSVSVLGTEQTASVLTRETVTRAWKTMLETAQFHWFYAAADDGNAVKQTVQKAFASLDRKVMPLQTKVLAPAPVQRAAETMPLAQAKLTLGFYVGAAEPDTRTVMAARLFAALFGGSPTSFLFRNVREKMSLCYYCRAGYDRVKGALTVDSGVDAANVEKAETAILEQLETVKSGAFSTEDLEMARLHLKNALQDKENVQSGTVYWYMGQSMTDVYQSPAKAVELLESITKEEVIAVANTVSLKAVFALLPEGGAV